MTRPDEKRCEVSTGPRTGRFVHASLAAPLSTEVKQDAIAAAPPASSLAVKKPLSAMAAPFMPRRASAKKLVDVRKKRPVPVSVGTSSSSTAAPAVKCLPSLRTVCTSSEAAAAGIFIGQMPEMDRLLLESNKEDEEGDHITPLSIGSNARSTGSSPNERSKSSEEVTSKMDHELLEKIQNNWNIRQKAIQDKEMELMRTIQKVQQMARECGADERNPRLWLGVMEIVHSDRAIQFFMNTDPDGRMALVKHYAMIHEFQDPRDILRRSLLKRDPLPIKDPKEEEEEEFFKMFLTNNAARCNHGTLKPMEVQSGGSGLSKLPQLPCSLQGKQLSSPSSSRDSKRRRAT